MVYQEIGERIRTQRKTLGLSQETLAELADVSPVYISQIERATKHASLDVLIRVAAYMRGTTGEHGAVNLSAE